jgi:hypothetical protein
MDSTEAPRQDATVEERAQLAHDEAGLTTGYGALTGGTALDLLSGLSATASSSAVLGFDW